MCIRDRLKTLRERDATVYRQLIGEHVQVPYELLEELVDESEPSEKAAGGPVNGFDGSVERAR